LVNELKIVYSAMATCARLGVESLTQSQICGPCAGWIAQLEAAIP